MKRAIVKSVVIAIAIMLISVSAFAADVAASVVMEGQLWGTTGFNIANKGQTDADLIQISISDAQFGASFRLYSNAMGATSTRKINIWLKPIDVLKIQIGTVSAGLFTEQLNWWMVNSALATPSWNSGLYDAEGGLALELTPVEGLFITAGIFPGYGNNLMSDNEVTAGQQLGLGPNTKFGAVAKYKIEGIGTAGVGYRFNGGTSNGAGNVENWQNIRVGMDLTMVPGLYVFIQGIVALENDATSADNVNELTGVCIDNYVSYTAGAFTVKAEFPFTLRILEGADDYLTFDLKASYKVSDMVSPFLRIRQNGQAGSDSRMIFYDAAAPATYAIFAPAIDLGANITLGKAAIETSVRILMPNDTEGDITWLVPFNVRVSW